MWYTAKEALVAEQRERVPSEWQHRVVIEHREATYRADMERMTASMAAYRADAAEARDELDKLRNTLAVFESANQKLQEERDTLLKATLNLRWSRAGPW